MRILLTDPSERSPLKFMSSLPRHKKNAGLEAETQLPLVHRRDVQTQKEAGVLFALLTDPSAFPTV